MSDIGRLNREELSIQARLNNRALKAATYNPLSSSEEEEAPRMTNTNIDIMNDTPLKMSDAWRKDIAFQVQNEIISNNAITDNNAFGEPMKIKSHVTQQMIDEYRAEQQNPLLLNNKTFVYHPGRLAVELETFTPQPVKISYRNIRPFLIVGRKPKTENRFSVFVPVFCILIDRFWLKTENRFTANANTAGNLGRFTAVIAFGRKSIFGFRFSADYKDRPKKPTVREVYNR